MRDAGREIPAGAGAAARAYWRRNLRYLAVLLGIWAMVSYGFGILLVEPLDRIRIPGTGFPLGFWFAQQGSIYVFVALIFVYVWLMNRLDREFGVDEPGREWRGRRARPGEWGTGERTSGESGTGERGPGDSGASGTAP